MIIAVLFIFSCDNKFKVAKPNVLIKQSVMENILYDIGLLKAAKSKKFKVLNDNNVVAGEYIYRKYNIDSVTLRQNIEYYSANFFDTSKEIEEKIALKLKSEMIEVEKKITNEKKLDRSNDTITKFKKKSFK